MLLGPAHEALHCSRSHVQQGRQHLRQRHGGGGDIYGKSVAHTADGLSAHHAEISQSLPAAVKGYRVLHTPLTHLFFFLLDHACLLCDVPLACASQQASNDDCLPLPNQIPISGKGNSSAFFVITPHTDTPHATHSSESRALRDWLSHTPGHQVTHLTHHGGYIAAHVHLCSFLRDG